MVYRCPPLQIEQVRFKGGGVDLPGNGLGRNGHGLLDGFQKLDHHVAKESRLAQHGLEFFLAHGYFPFLVVFPKCDCSRLPIG